MEEHDITKDHAASVSHRKQINSAIGTWSGFIYQGLCGILVALRMIEADRDGCAGYKLQLDGFEDFSILDEKDLIVSLHQCKCIKGRKSYGSELEEMKQKRESLSNLKHDAKSFFHCNEDVTIDSELCIDAYPFKADKTNCGPGEIKDIIKDEIDKLKLPDSSRDDILAKLEGLVNSNVLNTQQCFFESKEKLYIIARTRSVLFSDIARVCFSRLLKLDDEDVLTLLKTRYVEMFNERFDANGGIGKLPHIDEFITEFVKMDKEEMRRFMQRIHPMEKFDYSFASVLNVCSPERIDLLYNLVEEFPLDKVGLHWITTNSKQSPSTLSDIKPIEDTCRKIYENRANFDAMWIYDWFVGKIENSVRDIREKASILTVVEELEEERSIFREKTVGIMTIKDKRDGRFD